MAENLKVRVILDFDIGPLDIGDAESTGTLHSLCRAYVLDQYGGTDPFDLTGRSGLEAFERCVVETLDSEGLAHWTWDEGLPVPQIIATHVEQIR